MTNREPTAPAYKDIAVKLRSVDGLAKADASTLALHLSDLLDSCSALLADTRVFLGRPATRKQLDTLLAQVLVSATHLSDHWAEVRGLIERRVGVRHSDISTRGVRHKSRRP